MPDPIIKKALKDFVTTANGGNYKDENELMSYFPELKDYKKEALKDFVTTANGGNYKDENELFSYFPEFESKKKVTPLQPSPSSAIPSLSQTIEKNKKEKSEFEVFQPQGENVNVSRNLFSEYENVLGKRASLYKAESNAQQNLQMGGMGSMPSMVSSTYENLENQLKTIPGEREKYDAEAKKLGDILIPSIKTGIKNLEGKFTTKNGELDYSAIGKAANMFSQQIGGGDFVKEQVRQQIINQEEYNKVKPSVNLFANQVWKKMTGKTVDEFVGEKNQAVKDFILQKQVLEQNFQKTQVTLNKEYTAKAEQINEKYKAILSQAKSEEEQSQIASSYITEMNGLASQYNSRINRVKKEVDDELKSKISKAELSDETKRQLDIVYNEAYKYVTKANLDKKQAKQDELYGKNWYNQLLPYNPYTNWEKAKETFFAPKFMALGWKSATGAMFNGISNLGNGLVGLGLGGGFTDFLRGQQQRADRLESVDVELKGMNWLKPNTFATRLGKQIGFQAPIIAATAFTKNPFMAGTIGFGVEQVQNAGEVYNTMMQQYDDPIKAQNAAKNYLTKNLPTLPLYFLESEMMLRFARAKPGVLKNVAAENLNEVTQELIQGYTQQQEYKNAKSLGTFLKEDAPNIALETALTTTLQSGLFSVGGKLMKKLGTDVEYAQKAHLYDLVSTKGLNAAFGVLELKANNNLISPEEMMAQKEKLTKLNNDIFTLKDNGLTDVQVGVYLGLTAKLDAIKEKQAKSTNPQITQSYQKEIESIEKKIQEAVMGKLDGVSVTLPSGSTITLEGNGEDILSELGDEIATGQADITSTDEKVNQQVQELKQKSPPPVPDEALEQVQNEVGEIEDNFQQKGYSIDFVNDSVVISDLDGNIIGIEDIPADLQQQAVRYEDLAIPKVEEEVKPTEIKEPTEEEKQIDIIKGNIVTFTYEKESDVPAELKYKISKATKGENNGKPFIRINISKLEADYLLSKEQKPKAEVKAEPKPTKTLTNEEKVKQLRAEEQAEYDAMPNQLGLEKRQEIYNKYDKLITPLLEKESSVGVWGDVEVDSNGNAVPKKYSLNRKSENQAPSISLNTINEESFGGELPTNVKQVKLLEIRGQNSLGQTVGEVWIQKENGEAYTADVIFKEQPKAVEQSLKETPKAETKKQLSQKEIEADIENRVVITGMDGGFTGINLENISNKSAGTSRDIRIIKSDERDEVTYEEGTTKENIFKDIEFSGKSDAYRVKDKKTGKVFYVVTINNRVKDKGLDGDRNGALFASVEDDGNLPSNIRTLLELRLIKEFEKASQRRKNIFAPLPQAFIDKVNAKYKAETPKAETKEQPKPKQKEEKLYVGNGLERAEAKRLHQMVKDMPAPTSDADEIALRYIADGGTIGEEAINEVAGRVKRARLNTGERELKTNEAKARDYYRKEGETLDDLAHRLWEKSGQEVSEIDIKDALMTAIRDNNTRLEASKAYLEKYSPEYAQEKYYERIAEEKEAEYKAEQERIAKLFEQEATDEILGLASQEHINNLINQYEAEFNRENQEPKPTSEAEVNKPISGRASGEENEVKQSAGEKEVKSTISKSSFDALIDRITKAFPKVKFFYDEVNFNKKMKQYGNGNLMRTPNGTIYGATFPDGSVYINQKVLSAETPIHEASHIWEALFPKEWKNGIELFRQSKGFKKALQEVQSNKAYKNKTLLQQESEALNTLIGRKGEGYFQNELLSKFNAWLQKFFNYIGRKFGIKLSPDTKLNEFVNDVIGDILGGKPLTQEVVPAKGMMKINGENVNVKQVDVDVVNGFYSPLEKIISESKFDKLPAKQWLEKFAKGEEAKWTGLNEWLSQQQGSVSKSDIQQFLKDNRISVVEVVKKENGNSYLRHIEKLKKIGNKYNLELEFGDEGQLDITDKEDGELYRSGDVKSDRDINSIVELNLMSREKALAIKEIFELNEPYAYGLDNITSEVKFAQYQLEGEKENYKEVLVTMPNAESRRKELVRIDRERPLTESEQKEYRELVEATRNKPANFQSTHFDEPNILVHLRMNTRKDSQGNKVLFLEEIQSDWGQKGKKEGFDFGRKKELEAQRKALGEDNEYRKLQKQYLDPIAQEKYGEPYGRLTHNKQMEVDFEYFQKDKPLLDRIEKAQKKLIADLNNIDNEIAKLDSKENIPTAPFVMDTNAWTKLAFKVALKEAVKQGADKIAWTTGEQQNNRYDLSKSVSKLSLTKDNVLRAYNLSGEKIYDKKISSEKEIEDTFGKEAAQKLLEQPTQKVITDYDPKGIDGRELSGVDLKVGGKGMKGFYGSPTEGSLGIVGNVAKSLFKQEPKTTTILLDEKTKTTYQVINNINNSIVAEFNTGAEAQKYKNENEEIAGEFRISSTTNDAGKGSSTQYSIDITPELRAQVEKGQPLFMAKGNESIFEDYDKYNALKMAEKVKNPQIVEQLKAKYGQELNKVKDITLNFDKYTTQLLNSGYIKDKIC